MSVSSPPKKNAAHTFGVGLLSRANPDVFQTNPTLAAGDVKVSIDFGAFANLTTLPVVTPAGSEQVKVDLSAAEMNGNKIGILFRDAAGAEWSDLYIELETVAAQMDDLVRSTTPANTLDVDAVGRVDMGLWVGVAPNALIAGRVDANAQVVGDKTGYAIGAGGIGPGSIAANTFTSAEFDVSATPRIVKNTALNNFPFLMVDSTDHVTPKTGLTWAAGSAQVSIDGAAFANLTNLPVEVSAGIYKINLAAADLNGDVVTLKFTGTGADTRLISVVTQP